ncbi:hypothetical protein [Ruania alkalisoli]|uniref:hypothetical protein n=1 Tax=Ruania alkalisoli TaxID=2779775 RepID=UPI001B355DD2|nr:hypothetical protein [Ruania alkalisoli]
MAERTAWRICSANRWWSAFGKKSGRCGKKPGPPVHDDLCAVVDKHGATRHVFTADATNELWIGDIVRHEALLNRVEVRDHRRSAVAAVG